MRSFDKVHLALGVAWKRWSLDKVWLGQGVAWTQCSVQASIKELQEQGGAKTMQLGQSVAWTRCGLDEASLAHITHSALI